MQNQMNISNKFWTRNDLKDTFVYAKMITKHYAKSFYYSAQFFPEDRKWAAYAVYYLCRYVDNLVDNVRDRSNEEILEELNTFTNEYRNAFKYGESLHPALASYIVVAKEYNIPEEYGYELIEGVKMDMTITRYNTFDDLYVFCYRVASIVGLMMSHVMGFEGGKETLLQAEKLGIAMQLTNILRDIKEDKDMGRIYIPQSELSQFNLSDDDIINEKFSPNFAAMMSFQIDRARSYYNESYSGIDKLSKESQFAIRTASVVYSKILDKIELQGMNPFLGRAYLSKMEKNKIMIKEFINSKFRKITTS